MLRLCALSLFFCSLCSAPARAGLIVLPGDVTASNIRPVFSGSPNPVQGDAAPVGMALASGGPAFGGKFFGQTYTTIYASINGNLNFTDDGSDPPFPPYSGTEARLMAYYDILYVSEHPNSAPTGSVVEYFVPGQFLAVSWLNINSFYDAPAGAPPIPTDRSAQIVWFEGDTTIRGFDFKAGDIAIGHVGHVAGTSNFGDYVYAFVGLDSGNGVMNSVDAGVGQSEQGFFTREDGSPGTEDSTPYLAWQNDAFFLAKPNDNGTAYTFTRESFNVSGVPEPSGLVLAAMGAGLLGIAGRRSRMQRNRSKTMPATYER